MSFKKIKHIFFLSLFCLFSSLVQISFLQSLPFPFSLIHLPLSLIILFTLAGHLDRGLFLSVIGGYMLGIYSFDRFGADMLVLYLITLMVHFLLNNFFTRTSFLSSFLLCSVAFGAFPFLAYVLHFFLYSLKISSFEPSFATQIHNFFPYIFLNILFFLILYALTRSVRQRTSLSKNTFGYAKERSI